MILSVENMPSSDIVLSSAIVTPKPRAIACITAGVRVITELYSWARNLPINNTWLNWVREFWASEALAPEIETALEIISVISATWRWLMPSSLAF